jgi:hypothetical protein
MEKLIRTGLDTSKSVFQLHGVNAKEGIVLRKRLKYGQQRLHGPVAIACSNRPRIR